MKEIQKLKEAFKKFRYGLAYLIAPDWIDDLEYRFSSFLSNQTGNILSKCYYNVNVMISVANDYQQRICDECEYYIKCTKERENENVSTEEL